MVTIPTYTDGEDLPPASWNLVATTLNDLQGLLTTTGLTFPGAATIETTTGTLTIRSTSTTGASLTLTSTTGTLASPAGGSVAVGASTVTATAPGSGSVLTLDATTATITTPASGGSLTLRPAAHASGTLLSGGTGSTSLQLTSAAATLSGLSGASMFMDATTATIRRPGGTEAFVAESALVRIQASSGVRAVLEDNAGVTRLSLTDQNGSNAAMLYNAGGNLTVQSRAAGGRLILRDAGDVAGSAFADGSGAAVSLAGTTMSITNSAGIGFLATASSVFIRRPGGSDAFTTDSSVVTLHSPNNNRVIVRDTSGGSAPRVTFEGEAGQPGLPLHLRDRGGVPPAIAGIGANDLLLYCDTGRLYYISAAGTFGPL